MLFRSYQEQNLQYQRSLRTPDLTIGTEYDHNSNYAPHYVGLSVSLPLMILNRNQGNIKAASQSIKQQETNLSESDNEVKNAIQNALNKFLVTSRFSSKQDLDFNANYETLFKNITDSYLKRQISLIEFIDAFEAYKDTRLQFLQQQLNLQIAKEELNYQVGKDL